MGTISIGFGISNGEGVSLSLDGSYGIGFGDIVEGVGDPIFYTLYDCANGINPIVGDPATYTCATTSQYTDFCGGTGNILTASIDQPRIEQEGVLLGGSTENIFLNSQAPVTQNVTLTAGDWTISVAGTGSITTIYGSATASTPLSFVSAGEVLTCTVVGSLDTTQVENLPFATNVIYTAGAPVTQAATNLTYPVPAGFDPSLFSIEVDFGLLGFTGGIQTITALINTSLTINRIRVDVSSSGQIRFDMWDGVTNPSITGPVLAAGRMYKAIGTNSGGTLTLTLDGVEVGSASSVGVVPASLSDIFIGSITSSLLPAHGHVKTVKINDYDALGVI